MATPPRELPAAGLIGELQRVCAAAVSSLGALGAAVSLVSAAGVHAVGAASDSHSAGIEELQFLLGEGPCVQALRTRTPVLVPDLWDPTLEQWPEYTWAAQQRGVRAVFAFPLEVGGSHLGVLDLYFAAAGSLDPETMANALTFVDVAIVIVLDGQGAALEGETADGLEEELLSRSELFRAQGMVMVQMGVTLDDALSRLRSYAYARNERVLDVARAVVEQHLSFDDELR